MEREVGMGQAVRRVLCSTVVTCGAARRGEDDEIAWVELWGEAGGAKAEDAARAWER